MVTQLPNHRAFCREIPATQCLINIINPPLKVTFDFPDEDNDISPKLLKMVIWSADRPSIFGSELSYKFIDL